MTVIAMK